MRRIAQFVDERPEGDIKTCGHLEQASGRISVHSVTDRVSGLRRIRSEHTWVTSRARISELDAKLVRKKLVH